MKRFLFLVVAACTVCCQAPQLKQREMILHYNRPAQYFEEALPLGNGRLGAMVYGNPQQDRISLNDITLWTGEPETASAERPADFIPSIRKALEQENYPEAERLQRKIQGHFSENYQPLGTLWIAYPGEAVIDNYRRTLDLGTAVAQVSYTRDGSPVRVSYFVSAPDSVIVIDIHADTPLDAAVRLESPLPHRLETGHRSLSADGYAAWHSYPSYYRSGKDAFLYDPLRGIHFKTIVTAEGDGSIFADDGILNLKGITHATLKAVNATSFNGFDKDPVKEGKPYRQLAEAGARRVAEISARELLERHKADYRSFFDRVTLDLGETDPEVRALPTDEQLRRYADLEEANPELEALYFQYGRYLLISSSRTEGVPANLQGLWNESMEPPWSSNYTTNINLEENYWPAEAAALPEMHQVLLDFIQHMAGTGRQTAENYYGVTEGWAAGHNSDIWAMTCPVGLGSGDPCWANWNMAGAWLSTHVWEHYLFTRDLERLREDYPVLKGAAEFCMGWLTERDGELITSPSTSPENIFITDKGFQGATLYGGTADLAMIRECLLDAAEAAKLLADDAFAARAQASLKRLHPYRTAADGHLQEWYYDWKDREPLHRHQSHLFGLYPGHHIVPGSPEAEAAHRVLEMKGFETTGWSCGWRVNLYARLGDADGAYKMFRRLLRYVSPDQYDGADARRGGGTYPNLLDAHSPFQIDGNFGGAAAVLEMLFQSTALEEKTLPALPEAWPNGFIKGIRSRTGKSVTLVWENGEVADLSLVGG